MAAPTWVGSATGGVNANANTSVTYPGGTTTGDLLILFIEAACYANGTLTWTTPSGWAELASTTSGGAAPIDHKIYIRFCGGETSVTVSLNVGTSRATMASLHVWRGADATNPISNFSLTYDTAASSTTQTVPDITTPTVDNAISRFVSGAYTSASTCTWTQSAGTERTDHSLTYSGSNKLAECSTTETSATASAQGTRTFTGSITNGANGVGVVTVQPPQPIVADAATTGTATIGASATRGANADAATTGTATIAAGATRGANADAATTGTATISASASRTATADASTTGTASVAADATRATTAAASITGTAGVTADASRTTLAAASTTGTAGITATASNASTLSAETTGTASIAATAQLATTAAAATVATATITAEATVGEPPMAASTIGTATITASATVSSLADAATTGTATITAAAAKTQSAAAATTGTADVIASASRGSAVGASTTATATIVAVASVHSVIDAATVGVATSTAAANTQAPPDGYMLKRGQAPSAIVRGRDGVHATAMYLGDRLIWDGTRPSIVQIPSAKAVASMPALVVTTGASAGIPPMYATASMPEPVPVVNALVAIPTATATASMPAPIPVVDALVEIPLATATASMPDPGVLITDTVIGQTETMRATASMPAPIPVIDALVAIPAMTATASMPAPTPGIQTDISIPPMVATALMPAPTVAAGVTVAIQPALASALMLPPTVSAGVNIAIPPMMGSALMLAPTIATTIAVGDNLNRPNGGLGADWVAIGQAPVINTNRAQGGTTGASSATTAYAARHVTPLTQANQEVTQWIVQPVGTQSYVQGSEAFCRSNAAGTERVSVRATISGTTHTLTIYSYVGGVATSRGSTTAYKFDLFGNPLRLAPTAVGIRAVGNVYTVILNDIPTNLSWTDTGNLVSQAGRYWGFQVYTTESGTGAATYSNAIAHMDGKDYTGDTPPWKLYSWMQPGYGNKQDGWGYYSGSSTTFHNGVDIVGSAGRNIYAAAEGIVVYTETGHVKGDPGYGNYVSLAHPGGIGTDYAHMSSVLATVGQTVARGDVIGLTGTTGNSTTAHLHFGVRKGGAPFSASDPWIKDTQFPYQDPERFLTDVGVTLNWSVDPG